MLRRFFSPFRLYTCASSLDRPGPATISSSRNLSSARRKVRLLILSDTHGDDLKGVPLPSADVVLHCGDLTDDSRAAELERTLAMLRGVNAPLKLAIPGMQQRDDDGSVPAQTSEEDRSANTRACWELLRRAAERDNIFRLPQGTHTFVLPPTDAGADTDAGAGGAARLRLFASPLTPRKGSWGFQYDRSNPHRWAIPPMSTADAEGGPVDVVMTHGPPRGVRDGAGAGCAGLLAAVERARPRVHCFGHIHGAWGAELVSWKREPAAAAAAAALRGPSAPTLGNLADAQRSRVVASLLPRPPPASDTPTGHQPRSPPRIHAGCCAVDISPDGEHAAEAGAQTLFVNAALGHRSGGGWRPPRMPWLVDVDLAVADGEDAAAAAETMSWLVPSSVRGSGSSSAVM